MEALRATGTTWTLDDDPDKYRIDLQPTSDLLRETWGIDRLTTIS